MSRAGYGVFFYAENRAEKTRYKIKSTGSCSARNNNAPCRYSAEGIKIRDHVPHNIFRVNFNNIIKDCLADIPRFSYPKGCQQSFRGRRFRVRCRREIKLNQVVFHTAFKSPFLCKTG